MSTQETCAVCNSASAANVFHADVTDIHCPRCGNFKLHDDAALDCRSSNPRFKRYLASAYIRENQGITVTEKAVDRFINLRQKSANERARKLLLAIYYRYPKIDQMFDFPISESDPSWIAITWSESWFEVIIYLNRSSALEVFSHILLRHILITNPRVHHYCDRPRPHRYFVCGECEFKDRLLRDVVFRGFDRVWIEGISPAISSAGYESIRIDGVEHVNKIDDEIIATIRRSKFIVADLTGSRGGVYFEAGFAMGLGTTVIWTVQSDSRDEVHFDTRELLIYSNMRSSLFASEALTIECPIRARRR